MYYKVPAKFYIDPETGMTKAISPAGIAPQVGSKLQTITSNPYSRSLYPSLPYSQPLVMSYPTYPEIMAPSVPFTYPYQGLSYAQRPEIMSSFYSQPLQSYPMESNFVSQVPLPINPIKKDTDICKSKLFIIILKYFLIKNKKYFLKYEVLSSIPQLTTSILFVNKIITIC